MRCENGGICRQMFLLQVITEPCFVSNIITAIICSILMPWNAAYLWLKAAWNISHCDWLLTCWHIFICMPNTNHHVNPKAVGFWTNVSLNATISTIIHQFLYLWCLLPLHCNVCYFIALVYGEKEFSVLGPTEKKNYLKINVYLYSPYVDLNGIYIE